LIRKQVSELEISREEVEKKLEIVQKQTRTFPNTNQIQSITETNKHFLQEIAILKSNIEQLDQQIQQMDEREQMLVQYPDLNGPIEHEPSKYSNRDYINHI
jgi:predicted RNase H-like nuclease (RuvC/YqgF family)